MQAQKTFSLFFCFLFLSLLIQLLIFQLILYLYYYLILWGDLLAGRWAASKWRYDEEEMVIVREQEGRREKVAGTHVIADAKFQRRASRGSRARDLSLTSDMPDVGIWRLLSHVYQPLSHAFFLIFLPSSSHPLILASLRRCSSPSK